MYEGGTPGPGVNDLSKSSSGVSEDPFLEKPGLSVTSNPESVGGSTRCPLEISLTEEEAKAKFREKEAGDDVGPPRARDGAARFPLRYQQKVYVKQFKRFAQISGCHYQMRCWSRRPVLGYVSSTSG